MKSHWEVMQAYRPEECVMVVSQVTAKPSKSKVYRPDTRKNIEIKPLRFNRLDIHISKLEPEPVTINLDIFNSSK